VRVIIPAAGEGRRLRPHTRRRPKCLLRVGEATIVERLLSQLEAAGATDVVLVVGHEAEQVQRHVAVLERRPPVHLVYNPDYARSNSIVSLVVTAPFWDREVAVIESDIVVSDRMVELVLTGDGDALMIDPTRPPEAVDMAAELKDGAIWHLDKGMPAERVSGESLPLSRWSVAGGEKLQGIMREMVARGATDTWYQFAIRELAKRSRVDPLYARPGEWIEIDSAEDLAEANAAYDAGAAWLRASALGGRTPSAGPARPQPAGARVPRR
jgi:choline kinase